LVEFEEDCCVVEGAESEARAAGLEGRDDLADVVADEAEARGLGVLLND
jgi:hypothetical protein